MALPQNPQILECYCRIALDTKQVRKVRHKAVEGMKLSSNVEGARALLRCVGTDLRRLALSALCQNGLPEAMRKISPEAHTVLADALRQISSESEARFTELLLTDLDTLQQLLGLIATPETQGLLPKVQAVSAQMRNRLVPKLLESALTSKYHQEVKEALAALEQMDTSESQAALEKFRSVQSRVVVKIIPPGVGSTEERCEERQVYTSEFGQPKCEEELACNVVLLSEWEKRHPKVESNPAADDVWPDDSAQYYAAASARGIEEELLALVDNQLDFLKSLHRRDSLAPLAAGMDSQGEINGLALTTKEHAADDRGVESAINFFRETFQASALKGELVACAIFYHGCHGLGKGAFNVAPAQRITDADCFVALLDHRDGQAITCVIQYTAGTDGEWQYAPAYYAPKQPSIFVDQIGMPLSPNRARAPMFIRRPAAVSDHGTHPELMTLVESQFEILKTFQRDGSLAPVVASMKPSGEIQTALVVNQEVWNSRHIETDARDSIVFFPQGEGETTPAGAVAFFVEKLRTAARNGEIVASAIFFHGIYDPESARLGLKPAETGEEPDCIVAQLDHRMSQAISLVIRYSRDSNGEYHYAPAEHYSAFPIIFNEDPDADIASLLITAKQGNAESQYELALSYANGNGVPLDMAKAVELFQISAVQGHAGAQFNLGACYRSGEGVARDYVQTEKWWREAALQGHVHAQNNLGGLLNDGVAVERDCAQAVLWFQKAADQGDKMAQYNLAMLYHHGNGVPQDHVQAARWFRESAQQGYAASQYCLSGCYIDGIGLAQDDTEAAAWNLKAAEQGDVGAQFNMGYLYENGYGVPQDYRESVVWYGLAAEQGDADGQYRLGYLYEHGLGVLKDYKKAVELYFKATEQGHSKAQKCLAALVTDGPYQNYYANGKIKDEGTYENGKQEGLYKYHYETGEVAEWVYKASQRHGPHKCYYESGKLKAEGTYKDGQLEGLYRHFYENGKLKEEQTYKDGKREGVMRIKLPALVEIVQGPKGPRFRGPALAIRELSESIRTLRDVPPGFVCYVGSVELYVTNDFNDPHCRGRIALPCHAWNILASKFTEVTSGWEKSPFDFGDCGYLYPRPKPDLGVELVGEPEKEY